MLTPVVLPPGRAKLAASPLPTISSVMPTIGMVWVARCAAELADERRRALAAALGPDELETDVASLFPADRFHVAPERFDEELGDILRIGPQHAGHGQAALLRARRERR
jgi:hypothetical protein